MTFSFTSEVAIVTGAGNGLGRSHALALAKRGAKVVVNDLGGARDGSGASSQAAVDVVNEILAMGGDAFAHGANVANFDEVEDMVNLTIARWGKVDILINNAGILRDKSFAKMTLDDFKLVMDVHLMGSVNCCKAVWPHMQSQNYGRILMTTSSSGLYGNFGQANYGAAKMAVLGLMNTLVIEGKKHNIKVNALAPTAATRMTQDLLPQPVLDMLTLDAVTAGALTLCHKEAPNRFILCAGAGGYANAKVVESQGIFLSPEQQTPEDIIENWSDLSNDEGQEEYLAGSKQAEKFLSKAIQFIQNNK